MGNKTTWKQLIAGVEKKLRKLKKIKHALQTTGTFSKTYAHNFELANPFKTKLIIFRKFKQYQVTIIFHFGISKKLDTLWIATRVLN